MALFYLDYLVAWQSSCEDTDGYKDFFRTQSFWNQQSTINLHSRFGAGNSEHFNSFKIITQQSATYKVHRIIAGIFVGNEENPQIVSNVGNMANGDVKSNGGADVVLKG